MVSFSFLLVPFFTVLISRGGPNWLDFNDALCIVHQTAAIVIDTASETYALPKV